MRHIHTRRRRSSRGALLAGLGACLLIGVASPVAVAAPPANDDFAAATSLSGTFVSALGQTNTEATSETDEPVHGGTGGGASVWYSWTAPMAGATTVDTCDGDFDTVLAVYTGSSLAGLSEVVSDDDSCIREGGSFASFNAVAGQTYQIAVDGFNGATGAFDIYVELTPPSPPPPPAQCSDGGDNDGDGKVDLADPGCSGAADNDETNPAPPPPPDTAGPAAALSGKKKQKARRSVSIRVSCPTEACTARATGSINIPGARGARRLRLGAATVRVAKGGKATLKLKVSRKALKAVKRALRRRSKVSAKVRVTVRDAAGNRTVKRRTIRLTR